MEPVGRSVVELVEDDVRPATSVVANGLVSDARGWRSIEQPVSSAARAQGPRATITVRFADTSTTEAKAPSAASRTGRHSQPGLGTPGRAVDRPRHPAGSTFPIPGSARMTIAAPALVDLIDWVGQNFAFVIAQLGRRPGEASVRIWTMSRTRQAGETRSGNRRGSPHPMALVGTFDVNGRPAPKQARAPRIPLNVATCTGYRSRRATLVSTSRSSAPPGRARVLRSVSPSILAALPASISTASPLVEAWAPPLTTKR